ncbi:hypothetical protein GCM10027454_12190 [Algoriphagus aestuariicola]
MDRTREKFRVFLFALLKKMTKSLSCPNCETSLGKDDLFCPHCGQSLKPTKLPFLVYLRELLESFSNFDSKFLTTLRKLAFAPGLVVKEYNESKRARYVPPLRLYLFLSFFFFILVSGGVNEDVESVRGTIIDLDQSEVKALRVTLFSDTQIPLALAQRLFETENISEQEVREIFEKEDIASDAINDKIVVRMVRLQRGEISSEQIATEFLSATSFLVFVLMPLFALILKVCLGFSTTYYSETLVFSLYFHSLGALVYLLGLGLSRLFDSSLISVFTATVTFVYLIGYVQKAFSRSLGKAILISFVTAILYAIVFLTAFLLATVYSIVL